ncbi:MAG: hypothetical protein VKL42_24020 [Snowella sp.]|nr:hypothetical protein [Snowella sp.]
MNNKLFVNILLASVGIVGAIAASSKITLAQTQYQPPTQQPLGYEASEKDPMKSSVGGFDPMSLIHNANLSRSRTGEDFAEDSQRNLSKAAEAFKKMQQQQLQQMPKTVESSNSTVNTAPK